MQETWPMIITDEFRASKVCPFCFRQVRLERTRRMVDGVMRDKSVTVFPCRQSNSPAHSIHAVRQGPARISPAIEPNDLIHTHSKATSVSRVGPQVSDFHFEALSAVESSILLAWLSSNLELAILSINSLQSQSRM